MGFAAWLDLKGSDIFAFVVSNVLGFLVGLVVPPGPWALYVPVLVSYHLFLAWLVMTSDKQSELSLSLLPTLVTHLAFLVVVVFLSRGSHLVSGVASYRLSSCIRYGIAGLAIFERGWLFVGAQRKEVSTSLPADSPILSATATEYDAWIRYVDRQRPPFPRPGFTIVDEYRLWRQNRARRVS